MHISRVALSILACSAFVGCGSAKWEEFSDPNGVFTVEMPGEPEKQNQGGQSIYVVKSRGTEYAAASTRVPGIGKNVPQDVLLDGAQNGALSSAGGTLKSQNSVSSGSWTGREFSFNSSKGDGVARCYLSPGNEWLVVAIVGRTSGQPKQADVDKFFGSLKFLKHNGGGGAGGMTEPDPGAMASNDGMYGEGEGMNGGEDDMYASTPESNVPGEGGLSTPDTSIYDGNTEPMPGTFPGEQPVAGGPFGGPGEPSNAPGDLPPPTTVAPGDPAIGLTPPGLPSAPGEAGFPAPGEPGAGLPAPGFGPGEPGAGLPAPGDPGAGLPAPGEAGNFGPGGVGGGQPQIPTEPTADPGTAEYAVQKVVLGLYHGNLEGLETAISERATGSLAQLRNEKLSQAQAGQLKQQIGVVQLVNARDVGNSARIITLRNMQGLKIEFTCRRHGSSYQITKMTVRR